MHFKNSNKCQYSYAAVKCNAFVEQRTELSDIECLEREFVTNLVMPTTPEALKYSKFLCLVLIHLNHLFMKQESQLVTYAAGPV